MADAQVKRRVVSGALILHDAALAEFPADYFDPRYWLGLARATPAGAGRGSNWFVHSPHGEWVLRHYRRGGLVARLSDDRYVFTGFDRTRAAREFRLLRRLCELGLPVPEPVAARAQRHGLTYSADLITRRIDGARTLTEALDCGAVDAAAMAAVGAVIRRFHGHGAWHADLNAHNVLFDGRGKVWLIDFDRGRLRAPGAWQAASLRRLHRSLEKVSSGMLDPALWQALEGGYRKSPARP